MIDPGDYVRKKNEWTPMKVVAVSEPRGYCIITYRLGLDPSSVTASTESLQTGW